MLNRRSCAVESVIKWIILEGPIIENNRPRVVKRNRLSRFEPPIVSSHIKRVLPMTPIRYLALVLLQPVPTSWTTASAAPWRVRPGGSIGSHQTAAVPSITMDAEEIRTASPNEIFARKHASKTISVWYDTALHIWPLSHCPCQCI